MGREHEPKLNGGEVKRLNFTQMKFLILRCLDKKRVNKFKVKYEWKIVGGS